MKQREIVKIKADSDKIRPLSIPYGKILTIGFLNRFSLLGEAIAERGQAPFFRGRPHVRIPWLRVPKDSLIF
jgi:hypothetical protein